MIRHRLIASAPSYDPQLGAHIIPWASKVHAWVGFAYLFEDKRRSRLVYFVHDIEGKTAYYVHVTDIEAECDENGNYYLILNSPPDPAEDERVGSLEVVLD